MTLGRASNAWLGLVEGFETPFGLELLSTVHWVATRGRAQGEDGIVAATYGWNDRKKQFSPDQIRLAVKLTRRNWLPGGAAGAKP